MTVDTLGRSTAVPQTDTRRCIRAIISASSGNLVEWFDFFVYSFCSIYFASAK